MNIEIMKQQKAIRPKLDPSTHYVSDDHTTHEMAHEAMIERRKNAKPL